MPTLKQLTCNVEWEGSAIARPEFQTTYSDGYVESCIAVPNNSTPFNIRLQSNGYIAPGLSMFVYMDGVYQCNRFRQNLKKSDDKHPKYRTEVDFRVRQKEQLLSTGRFTGRSWNFERTNIVSETKDDVDRHAPYDGVFVGTIEVIVLRCRRSKTALLSVERLVEQDSSLPTGETRIDEVTETSAKANKSNHAKTEYKSKTKSKSQSKPQHMLDSESEPKPQTKTKGKRKRRPFGLDGTWDEPGPSSVPPPKEKVKHDPWDNWSMPPPPPPSGPTQEKKVEHDPWDNWSTPPPPPPAEDSTDKAPQATVNTSPSKDASKVGTVEMTSASAGIYNPVSKGKKTESDTGSQKSSLKGIKAASLNGAPPKTSQAGFQAGSDKGSQREISRKISNGADQQSSDSMHLRGGGSRTQSIKSYGSNGHRSPLVVNNSIVYNGVGGPPPLSAGRMPARDFWAKRDAEQKAKNVPKQVEASAQEKVDNWETGGSEMPGAWDTSNEVQKNNNDWNTSNDAPQQNDSNWPNASDNGVAQEGSQNGDTLGDVGNTSGWDQTGDDPPNNGDDWNTTNDQANYGNNGNGWEDNVANADTQPGDWETSHANNDHNNDVGTANQSGQAPSKKEQRQAKKKNKKNQNQNNQDQKQSQKNQDQKNQGQRPAVANSSKAGPQDRSSPRKSQATSGKQKQKNSIFGWWNNPSEEVLEKPTSPDRNEVIPGRRSPSPKSPREKKERSPKIAEPVDTIVELQDQDQARVPPAFSIPDAPGAKSYWSAWRDSAAPEKTVLDDTTYAPVEAPLYDIPNDIAERNKISHQVRPSIPARYSHNKSRPKYLDSLEQPYAVFVFHYRDKEIIEKVMNASIPELEEDEKQKLLKMPKAQLVDELIKAKSQDSSNGTSGSRKSSGKATYKSNPHGLRSGPSPSALTERLSKLESSKAPTPEKVGGWLDTAHEDNNGNHDNGDRWGENNNHENNDTGDNAGDAWGGNDNYENNDNAGAADNWDNKDGNKTAWDDNNNNDTAAGDGWNNNTADDAWGGTQNADTNDNTGWDQGNDTWNNEEDKKHDNNDTAWANIGFDGVDTLWNNDDDKKGDDQKGNDQKGNDQKANDKQGNDQNNNNKKGKGKKGKKNGKRGGNGW